MIGLVNYGRGNLFSLARALEHLGAEFAIAESPKQVLSADAIILPGVGAFRDAMVTLEDAGLADALRAAAGSGVPLLGICLGMQLLFTASEEFGTHRGLDLIPGTVRRLPEAAGGAGSVRIPNVGWRAITKISDCPVIDGMAPGTMFYFVHSYIPFPEDPTTTKATLAINGLEAAVLVQRDNVIGCQFHPEKSGPAGLELLGRFVEFADRPRILRRSA